MEKVPLVLPNDGGTSYLSGWESPLLRSNPKKYEEKPEETTVSAGHECAYVSCLR